MDPRLDYALELEHRDVEVAARIEHIAELGRRADQLGCRTEAVETALVRLPERRERVDAAAEEAARTVAAARRELAQAGRDGSAASGEAVDAAQRRLAQAEDDVHAAAERHARLLTRRAEVRHEEERLAREIEELRTQAGELAAMLHREARVTGLASAPSEAEVASLKDWFARARGAVLVARSGLETEQDRIVREANELATSVLGESVPAMGTAAVRERLGSALP